MQICVIFFEKGKIVQKMSAWVSLNKAFSKYQKHLMTSQSKGAIALPQKIQCIITNLIK
jgi:hypothetical protein